VRREGFNFSAGPATGTTAPERVGGARASANFLAVMGLKPVIGRDLTDSDDVAGAGGVALVSERMWQERFGGDANVLGKHVMIDGIDREIIGVYPRDLRFPRRSEMLLPLAEIKKLRGTLSRGNHPGFSAIGRLKSGVSLTQATADLDAIAAELERRYPDTNAGRRLNAQRLFEVTVGEYRNALHLLLAAVGCVLLIACANVANLQLARALGRGKEMAVRTALGASGWRLARQLLAESTVLALLGAFGGVMLTMWGLDAILALGKNVPRLADTHVDVTALVFTGITAIGAGLLVGIWPAWRISRTASLSNTLHEVGGRGSSDGAGRQRMRSALVITQVALAIVLLAGAGLMLKSFWQAQRAPLGFDPHGVVTMTISLPDSRYPTDEKQAAFWTQLLERLRSIPGIQSAAIGANIPFDETEWDSYFHVTGTPPNIPGKEPSAEMNVVSSDYFRVMGMPILRGRGFGAEELPGRPRSVIIDESLAQRYFTGRDPIGQHLDDTQTPDDNAPPLTIVGVVRRTRNEPPGEDNVEKLNFPQMYYCADQYPQTGNSLLVRAPNADVGAIVASIKRALDPDQPVAAVSTMETHIAESLATRRLLMTLLASFAFLALVLASVGLYGVMALTVTQRTRELGIRMALGAARSSIFRLVLGHGMALIGIGVIIGLLGAIAVGRALVSLLYGVGALDPSAVAVAVLSLGLIALVACCVPARRATRVDPIVALREE